MITQKTKYALHALLALAENFGKGPMLISEIARQEKLPKKFLELILLELKNKGILRSKKGKGGGYSLAKPPDDVSFGEVVRLFNGPLAYVSCVSQTAYAKCPDCKDEMNCGIRMVMKKVRDETAQILDGTTLADVLAKIKRHHSSMKKISHK
jgi:Rrf2 family protein